MMRTSCFRVFQLVSLILVAGLLVAADSPNPAPPKAPSKDSEKSLEKDPTKPRYVKTDDPALLLYVEHQYLKSKKTFDTLCFSRIQKRIVEEASQELEEYKKEAKPEPAVIRYLERKVEKRQEKYKEYVDFCEQLYEARTEYKKNRRVPVWIVEEYKKKRRDETKPPRP